MMTARQLNVSIAALLIITAVTGAGAVVLPQIAVGAIGGEEESLDAVGALRNIRDAEVLYLLGYALDAIANTGVVLLAPLFYVLFRGRNRVFATIILATLVAAGSLLMLVTMLGFSGHGLASSVPSELPSDSERLLEAFAEWFASLTAFGMATGYALGAIAVIAIGRVIVSSPASGAATTAGPTIPPVIGWMSISAGVLGLTVWLAVINSALVVVPFVGVVVTVIAELALAWWLLRNAGEAAPVE